MKDSGVEWIGEIPEDWDVLKLKHKYEFTTGFTPPSRNDEYYDDVDGLPWATISDLTKQSYLTETQRKISRKYVDENNPSIVKKGSLLYSFKLSVGTTAFAGIDLYTNEAVASFYREDLKFNNYLYYSSMFIEDNSNVNIYGAKILNQELIKNAKLPFPPVEEQTKIAHYLDSKTSTIDQMLTNTETSIEELKAYRQSLITEVVTKGLDPDAAMKDSGVEWIGEIPEDWNKTKIKHNAIIDPSYREINDFDLNATFLSMDKIKNGYFINPEVLPTKSLMRKYNYFAEGDILIAKVRPSFENGNITIAKELKNGIGFATTEVFTVRNTSNETFNEFLFYYLQNQNFINFASSTMTGVAGLKRVSSSFLLNTEIYLPSISEQEKIVNYIKTNVNTIENLIKEKQQLIDQLTTYKQSLIYEYVTGKKEVPAHEDS